MDLLKAFDCIPQDLLITKLHAHGLEFDTVTFLFTDLKERKQKVSVNNISSLFEIILSGVPPGSIQGPILFNIFLNDLFLWLKHSDLHHFADTIAVTCNNLTSLCQTLEKESESAVDWFKNNSMIANPGKFQAIILSKNATDVSYELRIYDNEIKTVKSVKFFAVEIDYQIKFNEHLSTTV